MLCQHVGKRINLVMKFDRKKDINPKYLLLALSIISLIFLFISAFFADFMQPVKEYTGKIITPMQDGVNSIGEWVTDRFEVFGDVKDLRAENEELKAQIESYKKDITMYQQELSELQELRDLYELDSQYPEYNMTAARVFSTNTTGWFSEFYLDKGLNDGISEGCNVLCGGGLAGIVTEVYSDYAKVRAVIDDRSNISAAITPSNSICTVEGSLNNMESGYLLVTDIDKDAAISVGDKVITSHISDRYMYGITIGYVSEITDDSNNLTKTAKLIPAVDFSNIHDVLVITDKKQEVTY